MAFDDVASNMIQEVPSVSVSEAGAAGGRAMTAAEMPRPAPNSTTVRPAKRPGCRGLHSSTFQLNLSRF